MLIAPTEPPPLRAIGKTSSTPERYGVDIMLGTVHGIMGIQRKELSDFFASVADGRLAREYPLMQQLTVAVLLIEGRQRWSTEGYLLNLDTFTRKQWSRDQFRSYMLSVQTRGVWVVETDDLADTIKWVANFERWSTKASHSSLLTRPKPQVPWGKPENRDWNIFLAQSFPGIGPVQAERILDHFGGVLPIGWTCTRAELAAAPGIGKTRLESLWGALPPNPHAPTEPASVKKPRTRKPKETATS